jgi:hypothetical protein
VDLDPDQTGTAMAKCKPGTKAISGGFEGGPFLAPSSPGIFPNASRKQGARKWSVSATDDGATAGTLKAFVDCRNGQGLDTRKTSEEIPSANVQIDVLAKCKRGQRVVSGGYVMSGGVNGTGEIVSASRKQGRRGWLVSAAGSQDPFDLTAYAYCEQA